MPDGCGEYEAPGGGVGTRTADCKSTGSVMMAERINRRRKDPFFFMVTDLSTLALTKRSRRLLDVKLWIRFEAAKGEGAVSATRHVDTRGQGGQRLLNCTSTSAATVEPRAFFSFSRFSQSVW